MGFWKKPASDTQITHLDRLWLYVFAILIMLFLIIPTIIVVPMSFSDSQYLEFPPSRWSLRWYNEYLDSAKWIRSTMTSIQIGILTMIVATPLGTMAAYALYVSGHPAAKAIFFFLITPMIVPVILIAIGTFYVFGQLGLNNSISGLVLAHTSLATPLVMIIITAALRTYDMNQESVARSLGATRWKAFFLITLPQIRFSVLTAALLSFLTSFDEVIISIFISGGKNATITKQMFSALRDFIDPTIAAISTIIIFISTTLLLVTQYLAAKSSDELK
ncbi:ABC transporter permease [Deltaproteobacteria bacterium]|nr:ABC transporter permease [Deltaproteobacteria bacterium]